MASPDFFGEPRVPRLSALLKEIQQGQLRVPRFQRPFVWKDEQRLELLESIYLGYPIGSILVWRTQTHALATYERLGPARLPPLSADDKSVVKQYLLDGHQRLTTLFAALGPGLYDDVDSRASLWAPEDDDFRWPIYFDLEDTENSPFRLLRSRDKARPLWLALDILYDSYALGEFKDRLRTGGHARTVVNRVQAVADIFRDYTVPVMPIATEELDQVTTSFKRVNSGGTRMSEVHMINALTWTPEFDLQDRLADIVASLQPLGWGTVDPETILDMCKPMLGLDVYKDKPEKLSERISERPDILDAARDALAGAARVLDRIAHIRGPAILPYSFQAILLADALRGSDTLPSEVMDRLRHWFWSTTLTEYFRGSTNSLFERCRRHLEDILDAEGDPVPSDARMAIDPLHRFDFRGARSRAMALLLGQQGARHPGGPEHDPFDLLATHGNDCMVKLIANRELPKELRGLADGPENRFLVPPRSAALLRRRLEEGGDSADIRRLAESHAIPEQALSALQGGHLVGFLQGRRDRLRELERRMAEEVGLTYRTES